jgi:hypothetical protein
MIAINSSWAFGIILTCNLSENLLGKEALKSLGQFHFSRLNHWWLTLVLIQTRRDNETSTSGHQNGLDS